MGDLAFAHVLADAADRFSVAHFRSEELRTTTKGDGTPVSQVDFDVEQAMLELVRAERPTDAALGEEVGSHDGSSGRRWIFDGIDGTHNYAAGHAGWGTILALEIDGEIAVGMVSSPMWGRRWWAVRGEGAWSAQHTAEGTLAAPTPIRCGTGLVLADASVTVIPSEGMLLGWRNLVTRRFTPPVSPRSRCFALDAVMVATGELERCDFDPGWRLGFRGHQPDCGRSRRGLPRRLGRRSIHHGDRRVHQRGTRWSGT